MPENVFVLGLNDFNRALLETIDGAEHYRFHSLLDNAELEEPETYRVQEQLDKARAQLRNFSGSVDAVIGYIDMPVGLMVPILCREFGLPTATLESVLQCQHKYWSRLKQREVIPGHVPRFNLVNPFADDPISQIDLAYPFWLKPVKSAGSYLGFRVHNRRQLAYFIDVIRDNIRRISQPFNHFLEYAEVPAPIADIDFSYCIAEEIIGGRQCTLEGYVFEGDFHIFGVIDSIRYANRSTFARYEYPSKLPARVTQRMADITRKFLAHIGFDNSTFNAEFFWDQQRDQIWLLEINTRISQSHSYLFAMVDGSSNHQTLVEVGLGQRPNMPYRQGKHRYAAKCFYRKFEDAVVETVPSDKQVNIIQQQVSDSLIKINVTRGTKLWNLLEQESYSYDIAWIFVAADSREQLRQHYRQCVNALNFGFSDVAIDQTDNPASSASGQY